MQKWGRVAVIGGVTCWSVGNLIVRDTTLDGPQAALWRYVIGAVLYSTVYRIAVGPLRWSHAVTAAPAAVAIAIEIALFFTAIQRTTVANVTVIASLLPLLLMGVAVRRYKESIPPLVVAATAAGVAGVAAVVLGSSSSVRWSTSGDLLAVAALVFFAAYFLAAKEARAGLSAFALQTYSMIIGIPVLVGACLVLGADLAAPVGSAWLHPIGLVAVPSTGHLLINWAHRHVTLTFTSLMTLSVPVLSAGGAWAVFGEELNVTQVAGMVVVLVVLAVVVVEGERGRFRDQGAEVS